MDHRKRGENEKLKGSDRGSRNRQMEDIKEYVKRRKRRQGKDRRWAGGRSGHKKVFHLVELKGQWRQRGGGMGQRGMKEFCCPNE